MYNAVRSRDFLIHGKLTDAKGEHCAIGSYFDQPGHVALYQDFIDEVAAVNDSLPYGSAKQRRTMMLRWLRWKLRQVGMPGFETCDKPK